MRKLIVFILLIAILSANTGVVCHAEELTEDPPEEIVTENSIEEYGSEETPEIDEKGTDDTGNEGITESDTDDQPDSEDQESEIPVPDSSGTTDPDQSGDGETVIPDDDPIIYVPVIDPIFIEDQPNVSVWAGQNAQYSLKFFAKDGYAIRSIDLLTSTDINIFPFRIERTTYLSQYDDVSSCLYDVSLNSRADAVQNFYTVKYSVTYVDLYTHEERKQELSTVVGILQHEKEEEKKYDPILYVSSLRSEPGEVYAGDEFDLILTLKNESPCAVINIKGVWDTAGNVVPINGATSFTISRIGAYASKTITLRVKAGDNVQHGNYPVSVTAEYEAENGSDKQRVVEKAYISINQRVNLSCSEISIYPQIPEAGQTVNVSFSIMNTGDATCQNIRIVEKDSEGIVSSESVFLGSIPAGGIVKADLYLSTLRAGNAHPVFTVYYEDDLGKETELSVSADLEVSPVKVDVVIPEPEEKEAKTNGFMIWIVSGILLIAVLLTVYYFKRKRRDDYI